MATAVVVEGELSRFLTYEEKAQKVARFESIRGEESNFRVSKPGFRGGEGAIDHEVLPLCDALNAIDGVCTLQSCCGHVNRHDYPYPGSLWIRLSEEMMRRFEVSLADLLRHDVIERLAKLYSYTGDRLPHEIVEIKFWGEPQGRMDEAHATIAGFFEGLAK